MSAPFIDLEEFHTINAASNQTIVAAASVPAGYHVRIFSLSAQRDSGIGTLQIQEDDSATALSNLFDTDEPLTLPLHPGGWFRSSDGKGIKCAISAAAWSVQCEWGIVKNV